MGIDAMADIISARETEKRALEHYGAAHQLAKTVEELGELTQAIAKLMNARPGGDTAALVDRVLEEAADVSIMLAQVRRMLGMKQMDNWKKVKIKLLAQRLEEAGACNTTDN